MTAPPGRLRILIADASPVLREALRDLLDTAPDTEVVAVAGTAADAIRLAEQSLPDIAVMDAHLHGEGLHAISKIHSRVPGIKLVALCGFIDTPSEADLRQLGVVEYLLKGVTINNILAAVRRAASHP